MTGVEIRKQEIQDGLVVLKVEGHLDRDTSGRLEAEFSGLFAEGVYHIAIDLSGVNFLSSAGAAAIITASQTTEKEKGILVILRPSPAVREVFNLLGMSPLLYIVGEEALSSALRFLGLTSNF